MKESYDLTYILKRSLGLFSRGFCCGNSGDRCWIPSEGAAADFADGFVEARHERGVREDGGVMMVVMMTPLKSLLSFRPLQLTSG